MSKSKKVTFDTLGANALNYEDIVNFYSKLSKSIDTKQRASILFAVGSILIKSSAEMLAKDEEAQNQAIYTVKTIGDLMDALYEQSDIKVPDIGADLNVNRKCVNMIRLMLMDLEAIEPIDPNSSNLEYN